MGEIPTGLHRAHDWYPHTKAIEIATAIERYMDVDDNIDRYLIRCKALKKQPHGGEWLTWLLDDDAKHKRAERLAAQQQQPEVDDSGVPLTWGRKNH